MPTFSALFSLEWVGGVKYYYGANSFGLWVL